MAEHNLESVAFPVFDAAQISALGHCSAAVPKRYKDGETLFAVGERDFKFFIVKSGAVEIIDRSGDQPKTIRLHGVGEFTGDIAHLTGASSVVSAVARGDCEVYAISGNDLRRVAHQFPTTRYILLQPF